MIKKISKFFLSHEETIKSVRLVFTILISLGFLSKYLSDFFHWGFESAFPFLFRYYFDFWLLLITLGVIQLYILTQKINNRLNKPLFDDFKKNLSVNWDFTGDWKVDDKKLIVTNSEIGGITKIGALWENYKLTCRVKILNECLGIIVRATDMQNYYMLQINKEKVRPHRRGTVPVATADPANPGHMPTISFVNGWEIMDTKAVLHHQDLKDWFEVEIIVKGLSIEVKINNIEVFREEHLLQIPIGKVGFRNYKTEKALVKDVTVALLT